MATLKVSAYDGDQLAAQAALDVQVVDDPAEYIDPRPDTARLEQIARDSGGSVVNTPDQLAAILNGCKIAPGESVVQKSPLWDHAGLWFLLLVLLSTDWLVRRWWGLA